MSKAHNLMTGPVHAAMTAMARVSPAKAEQLAQTILEMTVAELDNATSGRKSVRKLEAA